MVLPRTKLTRRSLLASTAAVAVAAPLLRAARERGYDRERRRAYEALVEALQQDGRLPHGARAGDRLAAIYRDSLSRRQAEIDATLDALADAGLASRAPGGRLQLLRDWANRGGEERAHAARALALAGAAFGPADRPLTVAL